MGYRLPLDSLPWVSPEDYPHLYTRDPFAPHPPLPRPQAQMHSGPATDPRRGSILPQTETGAGRLCRRRDSDRTVRRAAARPSPYLHAAGRAAGRLSRPRHRRRGHRRRPGDARRASRATRRRHDQRLQHFKVTPDPGVIEVNLQPATAGTSWSRNTDDALRGGAPVAPGHRKVHARRPPHRHRRRQSHRPRRRHAGRQPAAAPSRPVAEPARYWHNHPSLSYLFSGLFIGPTSQAPRIDEARNDRSTSSRSRSARFPNAALPALARRSRFPPSAHRRRPATRTAPSSASTNCIRPTAPPAAGLLELRALRNAAARAHEPGRSNSCCGPSSPVSGRSRTSSKLVRWGTELHDRFMLPHFVAQDSDDVLDEMQRAGLSRFDADGSRRISNSDFPSMARRHARRPARAAAGARTLACPGRGTGAPADGALRRFVGGAPAGQGPGMTDTRHVVTCNGRRVPLHPTGTNGEFVAGVRYRAWQPPSCLHPTIPVHAPLVFDLVDTWTDDRSAAAHIMSRIPAAAVTKPSRSTPTKPRAGGSPGSSTSATRPGPRCCRQWNRTPSSR